MAWIRPITLQSAIISGRDKEYKTILTTGARIEQQDDKEALATDNESYEQTVRFLLHRTPGLENALRGTATDKAVERAVFDDETYSIRTIERLYPNKIRLIVERVR